MAKFCANGHLVDDPWEICPYCERDRLDKMKARAKAVAPASDPELSPTAHQIIALPLSPSFRFIHEPLDDGAAGYFIGRERQLALILERIMFSRGGAFLITGYRGVGKTSFVNQLLGELARRDDDSRVVSIHLNLARNITPVELMFLIIRCLYIRLKELGIDREICPAVMRDLTLSYDRTLVTIKQNRSGSGELSLTAPSVATEAGGSKATFSSPLAYKRTSAQGLETSYLTYEERAAEYDLIRLSRRLRDGASRRRSWWRRFSQLSGTKNALRVVFVFDELDKIEDAGILDDLFSTLKNLFTTSGLTFIFVAGKDVQERWGTEIGRGESIYESVFAHEIYLPCLWAQTRQLCSHGIGNASYPEELEILWRALAFQGRGIPRRILRNFHSFIRWNGQLPTLAVTPYEFRDAEFYAGLESILEGFRKAMGSNQDAMSDWPEADKRALGLYYLVDWVLQRSTREFTLADAIAAYESLNPKLVLRGTMAGQIEALITELQFRGYIETIGGIEYKQFILKGEASVPRYRLTHAAHPGSRDSEQETDIPPHFGVYRPLGPIATGGIGRVVRALDPQTGDILAVKYVRDPSNAARALFQTEASVMNELFHEAVPKFRASGVSIDILWIAMEFIDAPSLHQMLSRRGALSWTAVAAAGLDLANTCYWLHERGYVHGDLKPSNVLITHTGKVKLIDFSTARALDEPMPLFGVPGTPAYMAPELLEGRPSSVASDVYALGIVLYELVCGRKPFIAETREELIHKIRRYAFPAPSSLASTSPELESVILDCMNADPERRPLTMLQIAHLLGKTPYSQAALAQAAENLTAHTETDFSEVKTQIPSVLASDPYDAAAAEPADASAALYCPSCSNELQSDARFCGNCGTEVGLVGTDSNPPERTALSPDIETGSTLKHIPLPALAAAAPDASAIPASDELRTLGNVHAWLDVAQQPGPSTVVHHPISGNRVRIGRGSDADIRIDDPALSRVHAIITLQDGRYHIMDAGSLNGTLLNGSKMVRLGSAALASGDRIEIGRWILTYRHRHIVVLGSDSDQASRSEDMLDRPYAALWDR